MQATLMKHDSTVVNYSSADAISVDPTYGNGKFTCSMNNANRGATHAVKVVPSKIIVPNVFPNIKNGSNVITTSISTTTVSDIVVTESNKAVSLVLRYANYDANGVERGFGNYPIFTDVPFPLGSYTPQEYETAMYSLLTPLFSTHPEPLIRQMRVTLQYIEADTAFIFSLVGLPWVVNNLVSSTWASSPFAITTAYAIGVTFFGPGRSPNVTAYSNIYRPGVDGNIIPSLANSSSDITNGNANSINTLPEEYPLDVVSGFAETSNAVIPQGYYSASALLEKLNTLNTNILQWSYNTNGNGVFEVTIPNADGTNTIVMDISNDLADVLGLTLNPYTKIETNKLRFVIGQNTTSILQASQLPHMGTTPIVHVVAREAAMNNMTASDSREYDLIATIPMTNTPYGAYASYTAPDIYVDDIDYKSVRSLTKIDFEILDYKYNVVTIDPRFPVVVQLKAFHVDTNKM